MNMRYMGNIVTNTLYSIDEFRYFSTKTTFESNQDILKVKMRNQIQLNFKLLRL